MEPSLSSSPGSQASTLITADQDAPALTRASGLWFEDCGLIIKAETTVFRVSRDVLAAQSSVFRDMLTLPMPKDADIMEGCPLVELPDNAKDVSYFLRALFDYQYAPLASRLDPHINVCMADFLIHIRHARPFPFSLGCSG
jgi:hypothetical protein